jgi:hypothetical protein
MFSSLQNTWLSWLVRLTRNREISGSTLVLWSSRKDDVLILLLFFLVHVRSLAYEQRASGGQVLLTHYIGFKDIA